MACLFWRSGRNGAELVDELWLSCGWANFGRQESKCPCDAQSIEHGHENVVIK